MQISETKVNMKLLPLNLKKTLLSIAIILLSQINLKAQYTGFGVAGGMSHFIGDVGHYGIHLPQGFFIGGIIQQAINEHYVINAFGNYGEIANDDALSNKAWRNNRNLNFRSMIVEAGMSIEFNFFPIKPGTRDNFSPYIFGGIGLFYFNPQGEYQGQWINLQPLGTEGQRTNLNPQGPYSQVEFSYPFGFGLKWAVNRTVLISAEVGFRPTATDFLDDVNGYYANPQELLERRGPLVAAMADKSLSDYDKTDMLRGNPNNNDWYIFSGIKIIFALSSSKERCKRGWF